MFIFYSYAHDFYFHSNIPTHYPHLHLFYVTMMGFAFLWLALWFAIYITFASKSAIMFHTMRWMCTSSKTFLSHLSGSSPIYLKITHTCVQNLREIHSTRVFFHGRGCADFTTRSTTDPIGICALHCLEHLPNNRFYQVH